MFPMGSSNQNSFGECPRVNAPKSCNSLTFNTSWCNMKNLGANAGCWETFLQALESRQFTEYFLPILWDQCGSVTLLTDILWFWKDNSKVLELMVLLFNGAFRQWYYNKKWNLNSLNWIFQENTFKLLKGNIKVWRANMKKASPFAPE